MTCEVDIPAPLAAPGLQLPTASAVAVDFETFYSADYSVSDLGLFGYTHHERFDAYLVSIVGDGVRYVGHPKNAPWGLIARRPWLSHNAGFDQAVFRRIVEQGHAPDLWPPAWHCIANLCVYVSLPRSLKGAVQAAFNITISKDIRDRDIKGKTWAQFGEILQRQVCDYALADSDHCLALWNEYGPRWPPSERDLSQLTYDQGEYGIYVDREGVDRDISILETALFESLQKIPWRDEYAVLSHKALGIECRKVGIEPPSSLAMGDEECAAWEEKHGVRFPWVAAMRDYRRTNALLEKFKTIRDRIKPDGRMTYSLLYFGAHTGRWSGAGGFNMQNMPRDPFYFDLNWSIVRGAKALKEIKDTLKRTGNLPDWVRAAVDMRSKFRAAPGKKLLIADYAQIEARVTPWLAGDQATLDLARKGMSVYEIHARVSMGWTGGELKKEDPKLYQLAKARVLGLGFGCGWFKFVSFAGQMLDDETFEAIFGAPVTEVAVSRFLEYLENTDRKGTYRKQWKGLDEATRRHWVNSWLQVSDFRAKNPKIVALWKRLDGALKQSVGDMLELELPSRRSLRYYNVNDTDGSVQARTTRGDHFKYFYGGLLVENLVQASARDVFAEALLRVKNSGLRIVMHTHDEIVVEADNDFDGKQLVQTMTQPTAWSDGLPVDAELEESLIYKK